MPKKLKIFRGGKGRGDVLSAGKKLRFLAPGKKRGKGLNEASGPQDHGCKGGKRKSRSSKSCHPLGQNANIVVMRPVSASEREPRHRLSPSAKKKSVNSVPKGGAGRERVMQPIRKRPRQIRGGEEVTRGFQIVEGRKILSGGENRPRWEKKKLEDQGKRKIVGYGRRREKKVMVPGVFDGGKGLPDFSERGKLNCPLKKREKGRG